MKKILPLVLCFGLLCHGQPESLDWQDYKNHYETHDGIYLRYEKDITHIVGKTPWWNAEYWDLAERTFFKLMIFNPDNKDMNVFQLTEEEGTEIANCRLTISRPGAKVTSHRLMAVNGSLKFAIANITPGTIVEADWTKITKGLSENPMFHHEEPLQRDLPAESLVLRFRYPGWWNILVKDLAQGIPFPFKIAKDDYEPYNCLSFQSTGPLLPLVEEPFSPHLKDRSSSLEIQITKMSFSQGTYNGPESWQELIDQFKIKKISGKRKIAKRMHDYATNLVSNQKDALASLQAIVNHVQESFRITREETETFKDLLYYKNGNAVLNSLFTASLLRQIGINARFALIHSAVDGHFDFKFITYRQFNAPAVVVDLDKRQYVVFPYIENLPVDYIPEQYLGQAALEVKPDGFIRIFKLPETNPTEDRYEEHYQLQLQADGIIVVAEQKVLTGTAAYGARVQLHALEEKERQEIMRKLLTYEEGDVRIVSTKIGNLDDYKKPLELDLKYEIDNLLTVTPEEVLFNTGGLFSPISRLKQKINSEERKNAIQIFSDQTVHKTITLKFPENWTVDQTFEPIVHENDFGRVEATYQLEQGQLMINQVVSLRKFWAPKERIGELVNLIGERSNLSMPHIVFARDPK